MLNKEISFEEIKNRIKRNMIKNVWFYVAFSSLVIISMAFALAWQSSTIKTLSLVIEKNSWRVLSLRDDGIPASLPLTEITPAHFEDAIRILIRDHLVLDREELTQNLNSGVSTWQDLVKNTEKLREFYIYYIQPNNPKKLTAEQKQLFIQANREFSAFVTKLLQMLSQNTLPTQISITSSQTNKFRADKNKFTIVMTVHYTTIIVKPNVNRVLKGEGQSVFTIKGYIDYNQRNSVNKLGIRPYSFAAKLQEIR